MSLEVHVEADIDAYCDGCHTEIFEGDAIYCEDCAESKVVKELRAENAMLRGIIEDLTGQPVPELFMPRIFLCPLLEYVHDLGERVA